MTLSDDMEATDPIEVDNELDWLAVVSEVGRDLQPDRRDDVDNIIGSITRTALMVVPGATWAAVTVAGRKNNRVQTHGATADVPVRLNRIQQENQAGPCLTALWDEPVVHLIRVSDDRRWPAYTAAAGELGVESVLSVRLYVHDHVLGALSLYSTTGFDDQSVVIAAALAAHAAAALDRVQERGLLKKAIDSRDIIGQAKGILMERHRITADQAFAILTQQSQHTNRPLRDVAERLTLTGELGVGPG